MTNILKNPIQTPAITILKKSDTNFSSDSTSDSDSNSQFKFQFSDYGSNPSGEKYRFQYICSYI